MYLKQFRHSEQKKSVATAIQIFYGLTESIAVCLRILNSECAYYALCWLFATIVKVAQTVTFIVFIA